MRLLTWNCSGTDFAKLAPVIAPYGADVAVLSEVLEFRNLDPARATWSGPRAGVGRRKKGVGVIVREGLVVEPMQGTENPSAILARVEGLSEPLDVLGIWTRRPYLKAALAGLALIQDRVGATPCVVAGDFNDNVYPKWLHKKVPDFRRVRQILEDELGLVSAYHVFHGATFAEERDPPTSRRRRRRPYWSRPRC
jgi:hypothetical protein